MLAGLTTGTTGRLVWRVAADQAILLGATQPVSAAVFSTPSMINLMEHAAREALAPFLEDGEESVGANVTVEHLAATPVGTEVVAEATVTRVDGKLIDFDLVARDGADIIGRGTHRRAVIRMDRFAARLAQKSESLSGAVMLPIAVSPDTGELPTLETLQVSLAGAVATVTLNRPKKRNAVNRQMTADWERLNAWFAGHPEVRVVIVTGAGEGFCAGDDVPEVGTLDLEEARTLSLRQARMYLAWETLPQVFIAAVNGLALGGGCVLAYSCDFRIAVMNAEFGMPEILLGWPPGYGVAQLTALVGKARALELCVTGRPISARTALDYGLVHEVVPPLRLMPAVQELTDRLLALPAEALRETKRLVHLDEGLRPKATHIADTDAYIRCLALPDAQEGIAAFREKRPARFSR